MRLAFLVLWSVWGTVCVSCIRSLTNVSLKSFCDKCEPLRWQMLTLLRTANSRRWKKKLICPFPVLSANGVLTSYQICHLTPNGYYSLFNVASFRDSFSSQKALSAGEEQLCQYVHISFIPPHHDCQVSTSLTPPPPLNFIFCTILSGITILFGLTVPQQFTIAECNHQITLEVSFHLQFVSHTFSPCRKHGYSCINTSKWVTWFWHLPEYTVIWHVSLLFIS